LTGGNSKCSVQIKEAKYPLQLPVPSNGVVFCGLKELVYCEAHALHKRFLANGKNYLLSKTLRQVQEVLEERNLPEGTRQY
jgi:two-component system LytT family response regulator